MSKDMNKWRLPTKEELKKLYEESGKTEYKIYWSSTTRASGTSYASNVHFYFGYTNYRNKTNTYDVRCARNTKTGLEWSKTTDKQMTWDQAMRYAENMNKETV